MHEKDVILHDIARHFTKSLQLSCDSIDSYVSFDIVCPIEEKQDDNMSIIICIGIPFYNFEVTHL